MEYYSYDFRNLLEDVLLAGDALLGESVHVDVTVLLLPDLEPALGPGLGVGQKIHNRLVVDLNE